MRARRVERDAPVPAFPAKSTAPTHPASAFEAYWSNAFPKVEGWVDARLAPWVQLIGSIQRDQNISGNIGEIGVYHGKFLIALAHLSRPGEKVTALDVFDDQDKISTAPVSEVSSACGET